MTMQEPPNWLVHGVIIAMLSWVTFTTHTNSNNNAALKASVDGLNARVTMLVQFMIPANGRRAEVKR